MRPHLIGFALLVLLAACQPLPRPFAPEGGPEAGAPINALSLLGPRASLMVAPVEGMEPDASRALTEAVAEELRRHDVVAFTRSGGRASWLLQLAETGPGRVGWRLVDPSGRLIAKGGPTAVSAAVIAGQVDAAAAEITPAAPAGQRASIRLTRVEGVSADADRLLGIALKAELRRVGIAVAERDDSLVLKGRIDRKDLGAEGEEVKIAWTVEQPNGQEIATIGQNNRLPRGAIDNRWPAIVGAVAAGAVDGIKDIVEAVETARARGG